MILKKKNLINFCHHFSTFLRFWALVINFDKINCYKMKWWTVEIIKQPCFVMYDLYFCHFKTYEKLHSALRHPVVCYELPLCPKGECAFWKYSCSKTVKHIDRVRNWCFLNSLHFYDIWYSCLLPNLGEKEKGNEKN